MEEIKRVVFNQQSEEDQVVDISVRPRRLEDFVGQKDLVENIQKLLKDRKLNHAMELPIK